jgi:malate synthase
LGEYSAWLTGRGSVKVGELNYMMNDIVTYRMGLLSWLIA